MDTKDNRFLEERQNHQRLNLAMQVAKMAWWEMDLQSHSVTFESRKAEMLGYSPVQFTKYEDFMALVHPDDYENTMNAMRNHLEGKLDKYEIEYRIKSSSGEYRWFYDIGSIVKRDKDGKPLLVTGLVLDISEQTFSKNALISSEKKFRDLFSSMMEGFAYHQIVTNENNEPIDYIFLEMNQAFEKLTGLDRENTVGKKVTEVLPDIKTEKTDWIGIYGKVALTGESIAFESYIASLKKWFAISAYSPQPGFIANVFVDITDKKQAEKELINFNTQLETKVHDRTIELENSLEALKSFSYTVSHDLRAPLRAIEGFSSLLSSQYQDILGNEGNRLLGIIRENTGRMNELISGLLELAKLSNDVIKKSPLEMNYIANRAYHEIVKDQDVSRIYFTIKPLVNCLGESVLIKQVWINLISNAVKFTKKKDQALITVSSYQTKNEVVYVITDNGDGFNPAYQNKLFVPFQRLHSDKDFAGSGIGLSIVERIISRHGGKVWAEGIEGQGATFYFSLPKDKE